MSWRIPWTPPTELVGKLAERIGVPFKVHQVGPLGICHHALQVVASPFRKECGNGLFARMPERRIAEIVGEGMQRQQCRRYGLSCVPKVSENSGGAALRQPHQPSTSLRMPLPANASACCRTNMLPGRGNTWVLFCRRRNGLENTSLS